jgi:hypothetical protein
MLSDKLKLIGLGLVLSNFLWTFLTSNSFYMESPIATLQPTDLESFCVDPRNLFHNCIFQEKNAHLINLQKLPSVQDSMVKPESHSTHSSLQCKAEYHNLIQCIGSLKSAISWVNWTGCLKERQRVEICNGQWCPGPDCTKQCQDVRHKMDTCVQQRIHNYLKI